MLVGSSMGGLISLLLAQAFPEQVGAGHCRRRRARFYRARLLGQGFRAGARQAEARGAAVAAQRLWRALSHHPQADRGQAQPSGDDGAAASAPFPVRFCGDCRCGRCRSAGRRTFWPMPRARICGCCWSRAPITVSRPMNVWADRRRWTRCWRGGDMRRRRLWGRAFWLSPAGIRRRSCRRDRWAGWCWGGVDGSTGLGPRRTATCGRRGFAASSMKSEQAGGCWAPALPAKMP